MKILAIDPGNIESAWVLYDVENKIPLKFVKEENNIFLTRFPEFKIEADSLAIEMIASYGQNVGKTVFDTCVWVGRYQQAWIDLGGKSSYVYRKDVKMHLCRSMKAKDSNIRQAVIDRYGGDKKIACGTKRNPGILYGMVKDIWQAMGVALTFVKH